MQLALDVAAFQFKLLADGFRDLVLSPLSIASGLLGLVAGGDHPDQYFRRLLGWGRKTERWINLFGRYNEREGIDTLIAPFRTRLLEEIEHNPALAKASADVNRALDSLARAQRKSDRGSDDDNSSEIP